MSSILIKGMKMPRCCAVCPLRVDGLHTFQCMRLLGRAYTYELAEQRQDDCPLVEVKPHGDLISRQDVIEVLKDACEEGCNDIYANGVRRAIFDEVLEVVEDKEILPIVLEANNGCTD